MPENVDLLSTNDARTLAGGQHSHLVPANSQVVTVTLLAVVLIISGGTLIGVFTKMKDGWGPYSLRAVGIPLVATFAVLLAFIDQNAITTALSLLGAIAGYLFGVRAKSEE